MHIMRVLFVLPSPWLLGMGGLGWGSYEPKRRYPLTEFALWRTDAAGASGRMVGTTFQEEEPGDGLSGYRWHELRSDGPQIRPNVDGAKSAIGAGAQAGVL